LYGLPSRSRPFSLSSFQAFSLAAIWSSPARISDLLPTLLQRFPTIQAVEWAPRVLPADRAAFEAAQQADLPGFAIRERDASGQVRPAGDRDQFYPVTYLEPISSNEAAVGFDLASDVDRRTAIEAAVASSAVTATAPIRLVQERGEQAGILLMH